MSEQAEIPDIKKKVISTGIRVGTNVKTKFMMQFINQASPEGLYMLDIDQTLARIKTAAKFVSRFDIKKVIVCSGREYASTPIEKFCECTGAIMMLRRFMPGTFTNPLYPKHLDPEAVIVTDPSMDQQAVTEASQVGIPVIAICDTDNLTENVDLVIPANNRGRKALAAVMWLLSRSVLQQSGKLSLDESLPYAIEDFETKLVEDE